MFGYVVTNLQEMKIKDYNSYRSYYCGLCRELKERYGPSGQLSLSYDMTFLVLLLTGLYEPDTIMDSCKCVAHPFEKHPTRRNEMTSYVADMNILLSYYQCMDDWEDERKLSKLMVSRMLLGKYRRISGRYPKKAERICSLLGQLHEYEKAMETNLDVVSGAFGEIMAEIFIYKEDAWEPDLRKTGFFLGKFIYLMDAYEDLEKDRKSGSYNVLLPLCGHADFENTCSRILTMMMADCSKAFERLPILQNVDTLRNILYSGVWCRYETVRNRRKESNNV